MVRVYLSIFVDQIQIRVYLSIFVDQIHYLLGTSRTPPTLLPYVSMVYGTWNMRTNRNTDAYGCRV